jgi:hypothetical protein
MSTDLEADLRREFDAVGAPGGLTFSPESVLRQGKRTIRRHRLIAAGSAAMAVGLVAVGANLIARPHDSAVPLPASHTATSGIFWGQLGFTSGTFEASFQLDAGVATHVQFFVITPDGQRQEVIGSSTGKPGQKPDATWVSGMVDGHPVTIGLVPSAARDVRITFADGGSYGMASAGVDGTDYTVFAVKYPATARSAGIQSIRWYGDTGIVDGIGNGRRLTGRVLAINTTVSVEVVLQPEQDGQTTVFGRILVRDETLPSGDGNFSYAHDLGAYDLNGASTGSSGAAVVTGRQPLLVKTKDVELTNDGPPIAAGILPPGASNIRVELTTGDTATGLAVQQRLPDGRVIFAMSAGFAHPTDPGKDSIKAVTWTFADGTQGRIPLG